MQKERGFTLIELMVALAILGIVLGMANSFLSVIGTTQAMAQAKAIAKGLNTARSEAITRGQTIWVSADGEGWSEGWVIWVDTNEDGDFDEDEGEAIREFAPLEGNSITMSANLVGDTSTAITTLGFTAEGWLNDMGPGSGVFFAFDAGTDLCEKSRNLTVNHLGHIKIEPKTCGE